MSRTFLVAVLATGGLILVGGWIRGGLVAVPIAVAVGGVACIRLTPFRHVAVGCGAAGLLGLIGLGAAGAWKLSRAPRS